MQRARTTSALVGAHSAQSPPPFHRGTLHQRRHVDRTVRDRDHQSESRLFAVDVGDVLSHQMGLDDALRQRRSIPHAAIPLHEIRADDLDFGNARVSGRTGESHDLMNKTYGLLAEFSTHDELIHAAEEAYAVGFRKMDGYAPFAVEGLAEALGKQNRLPLLVLIGGIVGGVGAYFMEEYANAIGYPINLGGRPIHSWPALATSRRRNFLYYARLHAARRRARRSRPIIAARNRTAACCVPP